MWQASLPLPLPQPRGAVSRATAAPKPATPPATDRQMAYALSLALRNQVLLPQELRFDRRKLSDWIDAQSKAAPSDRGGRPSAKQVAFAERLARLKRRALPEACYRDRGEMSAWIDRNRA